MGFFLSLTSPSPRCALLFCLPFYPKLTFCPSKVARSSLETCPSCHVMLVAILNWEKSLVEDKTCVRHIIDNPQMWLATTTNWHECRLRNLIFILSLDEIQRSISLRCLLALQVWITNTWNLTQLLLLSSRLLRINKNLKKQPFLLDSNENCIQIWFLVKKKEKRRNNSSNIHTKRQMCDWSMLFSNDRAHGFIVLDWSLRITQNVTQFVWLIIRTLLYNPGINFWYFPRNQKCPTMWQQWRPWKESHQKIYRYWTYRT